MLCGLKWAPADLKSGGVQTAFSWMCIRWAPAGSFLMSRAIFTPLGAGERVAVPTVAPWALMMLTVRGLALADSWARAAGADTAVASAAESAMAQRAVVRDFIDWSP